MYRQLGNYTVTLNDDDVYTISYEVIKLPAPPFCICVILVGLFVLGMVAGCLDYRNYRRRSKVQAMGYQPFSSDTKNVSNPFLG